MTEGTSRELTVTFDVNGNFSSPALVDYTTSELDLMSAVTDVITRFPVQFRPAS